MGQFIIGLLILAICGVGIWFGGHMATDGWKKWNHPESKIENENTINFQLENIQLKFDALTQIKSVYYYFCLGYSNNELEQKIKSDMKFRNSLIGKLIRLFGLRNELLSYNIDLDFYQLIDDNFNPLFTIQNGSYSFQSDKIIELLNFMDNLIMIVDSMEIGLMKERDILLTKLLENSSKNNSSKQIIRDHLQQKLRALSEVKQILNNRPSGINNEQFFDKLESDTEFSKNLTFRFSKLFEYRNDYMFLFYFDKELIELIDKELDPIYILDTEQNLMKIKENSFEAFITVIEKINVETRKEENTLLQQHKVVNEVFPNTSMQGI